MICMNRRVRTFYKFSVWKWYTKHTVFHILAFFLLFFYEQSSCMNEFVLYAVKHSLKYYCSSLYLSDSRITYFSELLFVNYFAPLGILSLFVQDLQLYKQLLIWHDPMCSLLILLLILFMVILNKWWTDSLCFTRSLNI